MPLRPLNYNGEPGTTPKKDPSMTKRDFFNSIDQLAAWKPKNESEVAEMTEIIHSLSVSGRLADYNIPNVISRSGDRSKLLVCHDFKGGYTEDPFERGYSFEFWHLLDTFIYFSHNRITLPPKEWVNTGHRHGAKVLGTIIFEWEESKPDLVKCLYEGALYTPEPHPSSVLNTETTVLPITTDHALQMIKLAKERSFDGYLLNIETNLNFLPPAACYPGGSEERDKDASYLDKEKHFSGLKLALSPKMKQRRAKRMRRNALALLNWATWLTQQGKKLIGPHWEVIWYDSVTIDGQLQWQDALTTANAPFFMNTDAIFTNYTWARPPDPAPPGGLAETVPATSEPYLELPLSAEMAKSLGRPSADVFVGIDVFGRGCFGGYDITKSLDLIFPELDRTTTLSPPKKQGWGLSVAIFAPGWTWEREKMGGGERSWTEWWQDDQRFWVGSSSVSVPENGNVGVGAYFGPRERSIRTSSNAIGKEDLIDKPERSLDPRRSLATAPMPFYTNFGLGSGHAWWVGGRKIYSALSGGANPLGRSGWTDIEVCFPKADRIWPKLTILWEDGPVNLYTEPDVWSVSSARLIESDAWNGNSSLELILQQGILSGGQGVIRSATFCFLPLCTLNDNHIIPQSCTEYAIEVTIKPTSLPFGFVDTSRLNIIPHIVLADNGANDVCAYTNVSRADDPPDRDSLDNGWLRVKTTIKLGHLSDPTPNRKSFVCVLGLRLELPQSYDPVITGALPNTLGFLVGDMLLSPKPYINPEKAISTSSDAITWKPEDGINEQTPGVIWGTLTWKDKWPFGSSSTSSLSGYFNISAFGNRGDEATWLGTSTHENGLYSFMVAGLDVKSMLSVSDNERISKSITFCAQRVGAPLTTSDIDPGLFCRIEIEL